MKSYQWQAKKRRGKMGAKLAQGASSSAPTERERCAVNLEHLRVSMLFYMYVCHLAFYLGFKSYFLHKSKRKTQLVSSYFCYFNNKVK